MHQETNAKNEEAPWQTHTQPRAKDAWNHSKEAREHPELYTTAHGTTDRFDQVDENTNSGASPQKAPESSSGSADHEEPDPDGFGFGHTVHHDQPHQRSPVKRDLKDI